MTTATHVADGIFERAEGRCRGYLSGHGIGWRATVASGAGTAVLS